MVLSAPDADGRPVAGPPIDVDPIGFPLELRGEDDRVSAACNGGPGRSTLQIALLQYLEWKFDPTVAAVSVVQILLIGLGLVVTDRFVKLSKVV